MSNDFTKAFRTPDTGKATSLFGVDFHQVALYTYDIADSVAFLSSLGFDEWHSDTATLEGFYQGNECKVNAEMAFNYQILGGRELEFVSYEDHPEPLYQHSTGKLPFLSHLSAYVDNVAAAVENIREEHGHSPYHLFQTGNHTNPRVAGKKFFREAIYDTRAEIGFNLKLIEKVARLDVG